jgi:MDMPI C-terminal domain
MHRVDAELAAGRSPVDCPPAVAADGIDELLTCFVTRPRSRLRADPPRSLRVRCTDTPASGAGAWAWTWAMEISADAVTTSVGGAGESNGADCEVSGPASDLYFALWNRRDLSGLSVQGDASVFGTFRDLVHVRW